MIKLECEVCHIERDYGEYYPSSYLVCKKCICARQLARKNGEIVPSRKGERKNRKIDPLMFGPQKPKKVKEKKHKEYNYYYSEEKREALKEDRLNNPEKYILIRARSRAKERGLEFDLEIEDILIPSHCPILNTPLEVNSPKREFSISIDRIDSSRGYTKDNIWIISGKANVMKNNASLEELRKFAIWALDFTSNIETLHQDSA